MAVKEDYYPGVQFTECGMLLSKRSFCILKGFMNEHGLLEDVDRGRSV